MLFRILNALVIALVIFLIWPLFLDREYLAETKHLIGVGTVVIILLSYLYAVLGKSAAFNKLLFSWVIAGFATLEIAMIILNRQDPYVSDVFRYPAPYVQFTGKPGAEAPANKFMSDLKDPVLIGPLGVRSEVPEKSPDEIRVVVLGGSTVFNGAPLDNSIPGLLEKKLAPPYRVYNFGVISYVSGQELSLLVHRILALRPDIVITYDGGNDIVSPYMYDPRPDHPFNFMLYEQGARILQQRSLSDLFVLLVKKSALLSQVFKRPLAERILPKNELRQQAGYASDGWERQIISGYRNNLQAFCHLAKGVGFRYVAFLQPMHHFKTPKLGLESRISADKPEFGQYLDRQFERASDAYAELSGQNDSRYCRFEDIHLALRNVNEEIYWDLVHTNNRGNQIIADRIFERLSAWKDPSFLAIQSSP